MQMSSRFILFVIQLAIVAASKGVAEKIWSANKIDQYSEYSSPDVKHISIKIHNILHVI